MSSKNYCVVTDKGKELLAKAMTKGGSNLEITHMAVGDGVKVLADPNVSANALVHEVYRKELDELRINDDDKSVLKATMIIPSDAGGWHINELGLFASTGDLVAVATFESSYKPKTTDGTSKEVKIIMNMAVASTDAVKLIVDPSAVLATQEYVAKEIEAIAWVSKSFNEHLKDKNPHPEMRGRKPFVKLPEGHVGKVNEGEIIGFQIYDMPKKDKWACETEVVVLDSNKEDVTSIMSVNVKDDEIAVTAPQVSGDSTFSIKLRTWKHGELISEWSSSVDFTVIDVPVNAPAITSPANHATGLGETPKIAFTSGSSDDKTKHHVKSQVLITNDVLRKDVIIDSGELGSVTEWTVPQGKLSTNKHIYIHARVKWGDSWSGWTTIDAFTTDRFQFIEAPKITAPQGGGKVSWNGIKVVISKPVIEQGGTLHQDKIECEVRKGDKIIHTVTVGKSQLYVDLPSLERNTEYSVKVRVHDSKRDWSDWSNPVTFRTKNIENLARVEGGFALCYPNGELFTFADGKKGYLIVAPASQKPYLVWGLYGIQIEELPCLDKNEKDPNTGIHNTSVLYKYRHTAAKTDYGNKRKIWGCLPADHCVGLVFEGCDDYFLPNKDELKLVQLNYKELDRIDNSHWRKLGHMAKSECVWSSSIESYRVSWGQAITWGDTNRDDRWSDNHVVACRRFIV